MFSTDWQIFCLFNGFDVPLSQGIFMNVFVIDIVIVIDLTIEILKACTVIWPLKPQICTVRWLRHEVAHCNINAINHWRALSQGFGWTGKNPLRDHCTCGGPGHTRHPASHHRTRKRCSSLARCATFLDSILYG